MFKRNIKRKNENDPLVFVNKPIQTDEEDVIGFSSQVDSICEAIKKGSTMVGVIADYGTGKSSLTELLCAKVKEKPYRYPEPIKINMWDSLSDIETGKESGTDADHEVSRLTKSFLYQLACGKEKGTYFSSYINRRLSRNYGNISFSVGTLKFWGFFIVSAFLYALYAIASNPDIKFKKLLQPGAFLTFWQWAKFAAPAIQLLAIVILAIGVANTCIAFSHWKVQEARETEINDLFDAYARIIRHHKPGPWGQKKQIIVIEDLDRIIDKSVIIGFIKELFRFQNSMQKFKERFAFVVSVKPEIALQNISKPQKSVIDDSNVYAKLFDITIPLKPIHYDDYDSVLIKLIVSNSEAKNQLEKLTNEEIIGDVLPKSFQWLKMGQNLTIRELKDRLNHAIMIMESRQSYKVKTAVTFEACTAVVYLENQYPEDYYHLIRNEKALAKLMSNSVEIINKYPSSEQRKDMEQELKDDFQNCFSDRKYTADFIADFCSLICDGVFNYDFRMYFYTYPKGSHIKTTEERLLCDMLLIPTRNNNYGELDRIVDAVYKQGNERENIVTKTLISLTEYPEVVLLNEQLLLIACENDWEKTARAVNEYIIKFMAPNECAIEFWKRVHAVAFSNKAQFISRLTDMLVEGFTTPEDTVCSRKWMIEAYGTDIIEFKPIFFSDVNQSIPLITEDEIKAINDIDISIALIDTKQLTAQSFSYISDLICTCPLSDKSFELAHGMMEKYLELLPDNFEQRAVEFLKNNCCTDNALFNAVCAECDSDQLIDYLNSLPIDKITDQYYDGVEKRGIGAGLSDNIIQNLISREKYRCILLTAAETDNFQNLDNVLGNTEALLKDCNWLFKKDVPAFVKVRKHICVDKADGRYFKLYEGDYPFISEDEYAMFDNTADAISCLNIEHCTTEECPAFMDLIRKRKYDQTQALELLKHLFDPEESSDHIVSDKELFSSFVNAIDYQALNVRAFDAEDRETVYALISPAFKTLGIEPLDQLRKLNCFVNSVEKTLQQTDQDSYIALIAELDELTQTGLAYLQEHYIHVPLSEKLSKELYQNGDYENYIIATVLRNSDMIIDPEIPIENYRRVYCNVPELFDIMSNHWDFLEAIQKTEHLDEIAKRTGFLKWIEPIYKVPQHSEFFRWVLGSKLSKDEKEKYLDAIGKFASANDSENIQKIICQTENIELTGDKNRYHHIWELFWDPRHKAQYTRKWNERWSKDLGHM